MWDFIITFIEWGKNITSVSLKDAVLLEQCGRNGQKSLQNLNFQNVLSIPNLQTQINKEF